MDDGMPTLERILFGAFGAFAIGLGLLEVGPPWAPIPLFAIGVLFLVPAMSGQQLTRLWFLGAGAEFRKRAMRTVVSTRAAFQRDAFQADAFEAGIRPTGHLEKDHIRGEGQVTAPPAQVEGHGTVHPVGRSLVLRWRVGDPAERTPEKYEQLAMFAKTPEEFGEILEEAIRAVDERTREPAEREAGSSS